MTEVSRKPTLLALQVILARAGWELDYVDIDLTGSLPKATVKLHRMDGRWLWARIDGLGRCTLESFHRESWLGRPSTAGHGRWPLSPQHSDVFLGRMKPESPRGLLLELANYITDNALQPVPAVEMQTAWCAIQAAPAQLLPAADGTQ